MATAFGILLFVVVYGAVAYVVYADVTKERSGRRRPWARGRRLAAGGDRLLLGGVLRKQVCGDD